MKDKSGDSVQEVQALSTDVLLKDADNRQKKYGVAIVCGAFFVMACIWFFNHDTHVVLQEQVDIHIPERVPVPDLKVKPSSDDTAINQQKLLEEKMQAQLDALDLQRREEERAMRDVRFKSAIIAEAAEAGSILSTDIEQKVKKDHLTHDVNSEFARTTSGNTVTVEKATKIENLPYKVLQGKLIEAVLEPRATSDLPGMICATVQRDVYGAQGRINLIPWGSRVCGQYNTELRKGQDRLFTVWNTVRRPDGVQVTLDSVGADQLGTAGMGGKVDTHFAQIFGMSALLSVISTGSASAQMGPNTGDASSLYYRQAIQQAAAQTSQKILEPYANIPPTVEVPAGSRIRIYVNRDLDFTEVESRAAESAQSGVMIIH